MIHFYKHRFGWVVLLLCLGHIATAQLTLTTNNQTGVCHGSQTNLNSLISTNATFVSWSEKPPAIDVAAGVDHNVAALSNGTVTAWGGGTSSLRAVPNLTNALQVSAARSQSFALLNDGSVVGWGLSSSGQLNIPTFNSPVVQVATTREYALAVLANGTVVGWGDNANGVLNIPTFSAPVIAVAAGREHNLALLNNGTIVGWGGTNANGELTIPNFASYGGTPVMISAGLGFSVAVLNNGTIVSWGLNSLGQAPGLVGVLPNIKALASGNNHSMVLFGNGNIFAWGDNAASQTTVPSFSPAPIGISAGSFHNLTLLRNGSVVGWGSTANNRATNYDPIVLGNNPTVTNTQDKTYYVVVGDNAGNYKYGSVTIELENVPPTVICPNDVTVQSQTCSTTYNYNVTANDNCTASLTPTLTSGLASGSTFPLGSTTNIYKATDLAGNIGTCSFKVTVLDITPPVVTCPTPITVNAGADCEERVAFQVSVQDNCQGVDVSGLTLLGNVGNHAYYVSNNTVTNWNVADADARLRGGHLATITSAAEQAIISQVNYRSFIGLIRPVSGVNNFAWVTGEPFGFTNWFPGEPNNLGGSEDVGEVFIGGQWNDIPVQVFPSTGDRKYIIEFDNGIGSGIYTIDSTYSVGVTNKVVTLTDAAGNPSSCTVKVTVVDTQNPIITCPAPITVNANTVVPGSCGRTVNFNVTATDNCSATITKTSGLASGSFFSIGTTTNAFKATDPSGNIAICSFNVTVVDTSAPMITCPPSVTLNALSNLCGAPLAYNAPQATDNCAVAVTQISGFASGSIFPVGTTTQIFRASDISLNATTCSFTVIVVDNIAPQITCPPPLSINTDLGVCGAIATFGSPSATDNCSATITQPSGLASGATFPVGISTITFKATDAAGNTASCSSTVTVIDNEKPVITCPPPLSINTDLGVCGAKVNFTVSATDNCMFTSNLTGLASGSTFPIGVTNNVFTATDASGNTSSCSFSVTVTDNEKPTITAPPAITSCTGTGIVLGTPTKSDNCGVATVTNNAPTSYPNGTTTIIWTVTDVNGNTNTATQLVNVAPITSVTPSVTNNICNGGNAGSISLAIVGGNAPYTYTWSNATTTATATGLVAGSYTVTVTSANGCIKTTSAVITQPTAIVLSTPSVTNNLCNGASAGKIVISATGGTGAITYAISPIVGTQSPAGTFNNLTAGTYTVTAKDGNNCTKATTVTVAEPLAIVPTKCYTIINKKSGKALDVYLNITSNYASIFQYPLSNQSNQKWRFTALSNGYVKIVAQHSGKVLADLSPYSNTTVYQHAYLTGGAADWKMECLGNNYFKLTHRLSNRVLDVVGASTSYGVPVMINDWNGGDSQLWQIVETTCPAITYNAASKAITAINGHADGARNVIGYTTNQGDDTDYWIAEKQNRMTGVFEKLEIRNNTQYTDDLQYLTFYDNVPDEGENKYRIQQKTLSGDVAYSKVQTIVYTKGEQLSIYPNPANDEAWIDLKSFDGRAVTLVVSDMAGKVIQQKVVVKATAAPYRLDLSAIETGLYLVKIEAQGKRVMMRKLQVTK